MFHIFDIYIYIKFFIYLPVSGYKGWFYILDIGNNARINIGVKVSLLYANLHSFGYMPRSEEASESHDSSI
jgi:hypothetical protein